MAEIEYTIEINPITSYTIELNEQGPQGARGYDGVGISSIDETSSQGLVDTYTITLDDGRTSNFDVTNGFSPAATVTKSGTVATITITDENGTTTAEVYDGNGSVDDVRLNEVSVVSNGVAEIYVDNTYDSSSTAPISGMGVADAGFVTSVNNVLPVDGNVTIDALPSQTGQAGKYLTTDGTDASWSDLSSRNIGEIVTSTIPLTDAGLHLLDGALIQYGSYGAFVDYIADLYTENPNASYFAKTEMDWVQPVLSANGTLGGNSFAVSASSIYSSTHETYLAFDNSDSTQWLTQAPASVTFPVTLTLYNPVALKCSKLTMTNRLTYSSIFTGGNVYGSDDNSTWNLITAFTNNITTAGAQWEINLSSNNNFYKYYKIEFTSGVVDSETTTASYGFTEVKLSATYQVTAEEWWQYQVSTYGVCGKFVYDSVNNTVRLPKITGITEGTTDIAALDDLVEAGLPNIVGAGGVNFDTTQGSEVGGAFYTSASSGKVASNTSGTYLAYRTNMDVSRYNSIYGNSTTVQPQAIKVLYYIVIATSTKTDIQVDIDEIATDLNGKADVDLNNITNTAKYIFDGQWVNATTNMIYTATTFSSATTYEYSLANYLPNDGYNYEVIVTAIGATGSTSGNTAEISIGSSFVDHTTNRVASSVTRTSNTANWGWCGVIPIGTDRKIYIRQIHSSPCTCRYFRCEAYRRIGSNS